MKITELPLISDTSNRFLQSRTESERLLEIYSDLPIINKCIKEIRLETGEVLETIDKEKLEMEIEKFLQIHSLRCKKCTNERFKSCNTFFVYYNLIDFLTL